MIVESHKFYFEAEVIKEKQEYKLIAKQDKIYEAVLVVMVDTNGATNEMQFATPNDFWQWLTAFK